MDISTLAAMPALCDYTAADLQILVSVAPPRRFAPGSRLCAEGKPTQGCFLLLEGEVDLLTVVQGKSARVAKVGAGQFVGQLPLVDGGPSLVTAVVRREVTALALERTVFEKLLASRSPLALKFQKQVAVAGVRQLRTALGQLSEIRTRLAAMGTDPKSQREAQRLRRTSSARLQAALGELSVDLNNLPSVEVLVPQGQMSAAETRARGGV